MSHLFTLLVCKIRIFSVDAMFFSIPRTFPQVWGFKLGTFSGPEEGQGPASQGLSQGPIHISQQKSNSLPILHQRSWSLPGREPLWETFGWQCVFFSGAGPTPEIRSPLPLDPLLVEYAKKQDKKQSVEPNWAWWQSLFRCLFGEAPLILRQKDLEISS